MSENAFRPDTVPEIASADLFVSILGCLSSKCDLVWPDGFPATDDQRRAFTAEAQARIQNLTLTRFIEMSKDQLPRRHDHTDEDLGY
jgi:hypothetical protein